MAAIMMNGQLYGSSNLPVTDASSINYDNTTTALSSTTVQGAIDESFNTLKSGFTNLDNEVNGDATTYDFADVITIEDAVPSNLADCNVKIEPVQDLHGYDHPWVGGAGKNKLPMTVDSIKAANTEGTWSGDTYTINGVSFTILKDADGNVTGVKTGNNQTAIGGNASFYIVALSQDVTLESGQYIGNGCPANGSTSTYYVRFTGGFDASSDIGEGTGVKTVTTSAFSVYIRVTEGATVSDLVFTPMIRLATETDATFAPYTNICPISGHTEAIIAQTGRNIFNYNTCENKGINDSGSTWNNNNRLLSDFIAVTNTNYTVSFPSGIQFIAYAGYDKNKTFVSRTLIESTSASSFVPTTPYIKLYFSKTNQNVEISKNDIATAQFEVGQTATPYTPYVAPKTYTISLNGTRYGGTVDFDSGVMTVTHGYIDLSTLSWTYNTGYTSPAWRAALSGVKQSESASTAPDMIADTFPTLSVNDITIDGNYGISISSSSARLVCNNGSSEVSPTGNVAYPLATPTTIQLTHQQIQLLKGTNTLTASTGQISVTVNGVSGSIGSVQEQVNGLAEDVANKLDAPVLIASSSATGTHAQKLQELSSYYQNLSDSEKRRSFLMLGTDLKCYISILSTGGFTAQYGDFNSSSLNITYVEMLYSRVFRFSVDANGTTYTDRSSTENDTVISLYA